VHGNFSLFSVSIDILSHHPFGSAPAGPLARHPSKPPPFPQSSVSPFTLSPIDRHLPDQLAEFFSDIRALLCAADPAVYLESLKVFLPFSGAGAPSRSAKKYLTQRSSARSFFWRTRVSKLLRSHSCRQLGVFPHCISYVPPL